MSNKASSAGIGLGGLVFLIFLVLKLAEIGAVAKWSWWWITCPLWGPVAIVILLLIILLIPSHFYKKNKVKRAMPWHKQKPNED